VAGFLQWAPLWHPLSTWLDPIEQPIAEPTNWEEWMSSGIALSLGVLGIVVAWVIYAAKRERAPHAPALFVRKFYWDEIYDLLWYKPTDALARGLYAFVERPLIAGTIGGVAAGFGLGARELGRTQNGLVRSYALALASGLAVLAVVFLAAR
jgi:NADH-quinone oxidoreductase subunit L